MPLERVQPKWYYSMNINIDVKITSAVLCCAAIDSWGFDMSIGFIYNIIYLYYIGACW